MDLSIVLEQLRRELEHLDAAILSLGRLQANAARRGRPPRALTELRKARPLVVLGEQQGQGLPPGD
jgi:hypothetical protein